MAEKSVSGGRMRWSEDLEDLLVDWWQQYDCLYDVSSGNYHNKAEKERCWEEIAAALDLPVQEVKMRAVSLRCQYSRLVRPLPSSERRNKTLTPRQKRILTSLEFLRKHVIPRSMDVHVDVSPKDTLTLKEESDDSEPENTALSPDCDSTRSRSPVGENSTIVRTTWTVGKENKLLELWQQHECLYNLSADKSHDKMEREKKWTEIATALELPVEDVKTRATSLRTQYSRLVKPGGCGRKKRPMTVRQKRILTSCEFLKKHIMHRPCDGNLDEQIQDALRAQLDGSEGEPEKPEPSSQDLDGRVSPTPTESSSVSPPPPHPAKKRPRIQNSEDSERQKVALLQHMLDVIQETSREPERDCEDSFGVTVAMELKRIRSPTLRNRVKRQIMTILYDALDSEQEAEPESYHNQQSYPREEAHSITVVIP